MFGLSFTLGGIAIWGQGGAGVAPPPYEPSLDFSDDRNSMYLTLF